MGSVLTQKATLTVILLWFSTTAEAGWLIDSERFHVSVHGQLSCQDCHEGISFYIQGNFELPGIGVDENLQPGGQIYRQLPETFQAAEPGRLGAVYVDGRSLLKELQHLSDTITICFKRDHRQVRCSDFSK